MSSPTLILFWDYDTQWGGDRSRAIGGKKDWGPLEFSNTDRLIQLHDYYEIRACFAVVGAAALNGVRPYHDPEQIRQIHNHGHEVASHSFRHDWLPGLSLDELYLTLSTSKDALEQCIGARVQTFVPPYNQPSLFPSKFAPAFSEIRTGGLNPLTISRMCEILHETGYRFARISYFPILEYIATRLSSRYFQNYTDAQQIAQVTCVRLNTPCGFGPQTLAILEKCVKRGNGTVVVYAHPHSLYHDGFQDEKYLLPFFQRISRLRKDGKLQIKLPHELSHDNPE